jgi:hypothetical protein
MLENQPRYRCTHCGRNEIDTRDLGCGDPESRKVKVPYSDGFFHWVGTETAACPMELRRWRDRILYRLFGVLP